jgi:hypothetical protein
LVEPVTVLCYAWNRRRRYATVYPFWSHRSDSLRETATHQEPFSGVAHEFIAASQPRSEDSSRVLRVVATWYDEIVEGKTQLPSLSAGLVPWSSVFRWVSRPVQLQSLAGSSRASR